MKPAKLIMARWAGAIGAFYLANYLLRLSPDSWGMIELPLTWMALKGALTYGALGLLQGLILQRHMPVKPLMFALLGAAAGALAMLGTAGLYRYVGAGELPVVVMHSLIGALSGALLGGLQLLALQGQLRNPVSWPAIATLAWGLGYALESGVIYLAYTSMGVEDFTLMVGAAGALASMAIGGISGIAAVKLALQGATNDPARRVEQTGQEHHR